jgi:hypothetical protein
VFEGHQQAFSRVGIQKIIWAIADEMSSDVDASDSGCIRISAFFGLAQLWAVGSTKPAQP